MASADASRLAPAVLRRLELPLLETALVHDMAYITFATRPGETDAFHNRLAIWRDASGERLSAEDTG